MDWVWIWLGVVVVALVLEFVTMELVSVWFAFGGFVSLIMSLTPASVASQWIVFAIVSLACILGLRKLSLKLLQKDQDHKVTNKELTIGTTTKLLEGINKTKKGLIKVNGVEWTAIAENEDAEIEEGSLVKIVGQRGNKYIVKLEKTEKTKKEEKGE